MAVNTIETQIKLAIDAGNSAQTIGELKRSIKELESIAVANSESNQEAFQAAAMAAGALKDKIEDAKDAINTFKGDPIENLSKGFGNLKGKLTDLDFKGFSDEVGRLKTVSKDLSFKQFAGSIGETGKAFLGLGKILLTNPIFLIATIVTTIIAKFDELKTAGGIIGKVFGAIGDVIGFVIDKLKELADWLGLTDFAGQEKAENTLKNAEKEQAAVEERYDAEIKIAQAAGKETTELEIEKQKAVIASVNAQIKAIQDLGKAQGSLSDSQKENIADLQKTVRDAQTEITVIETKAAKERQDEADKAAEKRAEAAQKAADKRKQEAEKEKARIKSEQEDVTKTLADEEEKRRQDKLSAKDKELRQEELQFELLKTKANGDKKILAQIEENYELEKKAIREKYNQIELDKLKQLEFEKNQIRLDAQDKEFEARLEAFGTEEDKEIQAVNQKYEKLFELANLNTEEEKQLLIKQQSEVTAIEQKFRDDEVKKNKESYESDLANKKQLEQTKLNVASSVVGALQSLNNSFTAKNKEQAKRQFNINKGLQIASTLIDTYKSATAAFSSLAGIPIVGPVLGGVAAGAAVVAGLAQVNKIRQTKFDDGGGGAAAGGASAAPSINLGGAGGGGLAPQAPQSFNAPSFFGIGQGQSSNSSSNQQTQVYVTETDITRVQKKVNVIENRATIG